MPTTRFTRMMSSNVVAQMYVSDDSRFVILPVLQVAQEIKAWLVYDTTTGELLKSEQSDGPVEGSWKYLAEARAWVNKTYYAEK